MGYGIHDRRAATDQGFVMLVLVARRPARPLGARMAMRFAY